MPPLIPPHIFDGPRWKNRRVGLLGGSFNPPHEGHVHISQAALKAMDLDCIWWLVTPQNPLKNESPLPLDTRLHLCRELVNDPRILISNIEHLLGATNTYETIQALNSRFPSTRFIWISGMDNAHSLHTWNRWKDLLQNICMVHITRAPAQSLVKASPLSLYGKQKHVVVDRGGHLPLTPGTTYWLMQKKMVDISSTALRRQEKVKK